MNGSKFKISLIAVIFSLILGISSVLAGLITHHTIHNSGSIGLLSTQPIGVYNSEIRALFVHGMSFINADWATIIQTAKDYGINTMVFEILGNNYARYPSAYIPYADYGFSNIISEGHSRGVDIHVSMNVLLSSPGDEYKVVAANGELRDWTCPVKAVSRTLLKNLVEELVSNYDIDGFMFDYARYDSADVCYCPECKAAFENYLGESIAVWPGDFAPGASRYKEFMEWRPLTVDELVRDMRQWLLAIKPDLEISAAVWGWEPTNPTYNRYWIGQDSARWVKEGWLDWVAPMMYTTDINRIAAFIQDYNEYLTGGPEGKIPLVAFLSNAFPSTVDPSNFKQQVDTVRANGGDGWIVWRYGGPGDGEGSGAPDIRDYLNLIDLYPRFAIRNVTASPTENSCTINWTTDLPASSKVEYSASPLFNATFKLFTEFGMNYHYWDIDHVSGIVVEDSATVTEHSFLLSGLSSGTQYYFRIQSFDANGIATSEVYTFEL